MFTLTKYITMAALISLSPLASAQSTDDQTPQIPMTSSEFQEFVQGRTLTYLQDGQPYGAEQYFSNKRVRWAFADGTCLDGTWYQEEQHICFAYDDGGEVQCWLFFHNGSTLEAQFDGGETSSNYQAQIADGPLACTAPGLGV